MKATFFLAPILAIAVYGCGSSPSVSTSTTGGSNKSSSGEAGSTGIVGKWKVDPEFEKANSGIKPEGFMTGFASTFWYDLKADKTFEGSMSSGTYTVSGNTVTITTTKMMGKDISETTGKPGGVDMKGDLTNDGKTLTLHPPENPMMPAELKSGIKMAKSGS